MYSVWSLWDSITHQQSKAELHDNVTWQHSKACALLLGVCTAVTLVPAWLIEFRYKCLCLTANHGFLVNLRRLCTVVNLGQKRDILGFQPDSVDAPLSL